MSTASPAVAEYRRRRNRCVIGMVISVLLANIISYLLFDIKQSVTMNALTYTLMAVMLASGLTIIGLFIAACWFYARMRGHAGPIGLLAALVGLGVWLGSALYLLQPVLAAQAQGLIEKPASQIPFTFWAGFAVAGLLLKALPDRSSSHEASAQKA